MNVSFNRKTQGIYRVHVNTSLNLRARPSTDSTVLASLKNKSVVIVTGYVSGDFYSCIYISGDSLYSGFVSKKYIKKEVELL